MYYKFFDIVCMYFFLRILDDFNIFRMYVQYIQDGLKLCRIRFLQEDLDVEDSEIGLEFGFQIVLIDLFDLGEKRDKIFYVIILVYDFEEENEEVYDSDNSVDLFQLIQV